MSLRIATRNIGDGEVAKLPVIPCSRRASAGAEVFFGSHKLLCTAYKYYVIVNASNISVLYLDDLVIAFKFYDDGDLVFAECVLASCAQQRKCRKETKIFSNCLSIIVSVAFAEYKNITWQCPICRRSQWHTGAMVQNRRRTRPPKWQNIWERGVQEIGML